MAPNATASLRFSSMPSSPIFFIQLRSAPAQNTLPRPASTTARTAASASSSAKDVLSSVIMASLKALRTSGRLSQSTATPWPCWISIVLYSIFPFLGLLRLDRDLGADRIGDEAAFVRLFVQLAQLIRARHGAAEHDRRAQRDARHRRPAFGVLAEHAHRVIDVAVDDELAGHGEMQEPQHVAGRQRRDERLLGVNAGCARRCRGNILRRRAGEILQAVREPHTVRAVVGGVGELRGRPLPFHDRGVLGHRYILKTPKRLSSIGALSEAEIARASMRRVSSGAIRPSSQSRAVA